MLVFRNPQNGYVEVSKRPWLWILLSGGWYFAFKGIWRHFAVLYILEICLTISFGLFEYLDEIALINQTQIPPVIFFIIAFELIILLLIYPFFADSILRNNYLRKGWEEVDLEKAQKQSSGEAES